MNMILFFVYISKTRFTEFQKHMLFVHIVLIVSLRQFQCAPMTYVNSTNVCFSPKTFFHNLLNYIISNNSV